MTLEQVLKWKPGTRVVLSADLWSHKIYRAYLTIRRTETRNILFEDNERKITNIRIPDVSNASIDNLPRGIKVRGVSGWATLELMEGRNKL